MIPLNNTRLTDEQIQTAYDNQDYDSIILANTGLVFGIINNKYRGNEDLLDLGLIGLIRGVYSFKPLKGNKISTYLTHCISNEINRYLNRSKVKNYEKVISLDVLQVDNDDNLLNLIAANCIDPLDELLCEEKSKIIRDCIESLRENDKYVIYSFYGLYGYPKQTQSQIAEHLGCSRQSVNKLCKRLLITLNRKLGGKL